MFETIQVMLAFVLFMVCLACLLGLVHRYSPATNTVRELNEQIREAIKRSEEEER